MLKSNGHSPRHNLCDQKDNAKLPEVLSERGHRKSEYITYRLAGQHVSNLVCSIACPSSEMLPQTATVHNESWHNISCEAVPLHESACKPTETPGSTYTTLLFHRVEGSFQLMWCIKAFWWCHTYFFVAQSMPTMLLSTTACGVDFVNTHVESWMQSCEDDYGLCQVRGCYWNNCTLVVRPACR